MSHFMCITLLVAVKNLLFGMAVSNCHQWGQVGIVKFLWLVSDVLLHLLWFKHVYWSCCMFWPTWQSSWGWRICGRICRYHGETLGVGCRVLEYPIWERFKQTVWRDGGATRLQLVRLHGWCCDCEYVVTLPSSGKSLMILFPTWSPS